MKFKLFAIILVSVVFVGAIFAYVSMKEDTLETSPNKSTSASAARAKEAAGRPLRADAYVDYSDTVIKSTPGTKLLFFHASWCPQCRALDRDITGATIPDDVTIIKVDYDKHQDLRQKYGVTIQTTVVRVDDEGELVDKYVAYHQPTFEAVRQHLLK